MNYVFPSTLAEAVDILAANAGRARVIAGGTDLAPMFRDGKIDASVLVDITRIAGLGEIEIGDEWIVVGAAVTFAMLRDTPYFRERVPALAQAAASVGAAPIQAMATWLGNIAQAMPAADGGIVAVALEAEALVEDPAGSRWVPVETLYKGAKTSSLDSTRQLLSHLRFPRPRAGWASSWQRSGRRPSLTLPILNCAVTLRLAPLATPQAQAATAGLATTQAHAAPAMLAAPQAPAASAPAAAPEGAAPSATIASATIALGPVATLPFRARGVEAFLAGKTPDNYVIEEAAALATSECHPRSNPLRASGDYRSALIPTLVGKALREARDRAIATMVREQQ